MPFSYRELILGGKTFCYCLPVRLGVISMSILGMIVGGLLSLVLWFEVASTDQLTAGERAAFAIAAILETILFLTSIFGFVGAIVRKQTFLQTYAFTLYVHFVFNIAGAAYLLHSIVSFQKNITEKACEAAISDEGAREQCSGLLRITAAVAVVIAVVILLIELYGAIITTRYLNLVKHDKQTARAFRQNVDEAFGMKTQRFTYTRLGSEQQGQAQDEFDPYAEVQQSRGNPDLERQSGTPIDPNTPQIPIIKFDYASQRGELSPSYDSQFNPYASPRNSLPPSGTSLGRQASAVVDPTRPALPIEHGYGGGAWTHQEITEEEKTRLRRESGPSDPVEDISEEEKERRRGEQKSVHGPPTASVGDHEEPLPQYMPYNPTNARFPEPDSLR